MRTSIASLRAIGPCIAVAGTAQLLVSRLDTSDYSETTLWMLFVGWFFGGLALAWFEPRPLLVYLGAVALAAPPISYSILGHGSLEMGGWIHAFAAGAWIMPFYLLLQRVRGRKVGFKPSAGKEAAEG